MGEVLVWGRACVCTSRQRFPSQCFFQLPRFLDINIVYPSRILFVSETTTQIAQISYQKPWLVRLRKRFCHPFKWWPSTKTRNKKTRSSTNQELGCYMKLNRWISFSPHQKIWKPPIFEVASGRTDFSCFPPSFHFLGLHRIPCHACRSCALDLSGLSENFVCGERSGKVQV